MESSQTQQEPRKSMSMAGLQLLTPEEPLLNSFTTPSKPVVLTQTASPPESPAFRPFTTEDGFTAGDGVLFPQNTPNSTALQGPLFEPTAPRCATPDRQESAEVEIGSPAQTSSDRRSSQSTDIELLDAPIAQSRIGSVGADAVVPVRTRESIGVATLFQTHKMDYHRYMMAQNEEHFRSIKDKRLPPLAQSATGTRANGRERYDQQQVSRLDRGRIEKPRAATQAAGRAKATRVAPPKVVGPELSPAPIKTETKRGRRQTSTPASSTGGALQAAQPKQRTRAAPTKTVEGKDVDWTQIPDFCPPVDSLDQSSKKLGTIWNNSNPLDLSNDPDKQHLHPQELELATTLRLKGRDYLKNKRAIFQAKLQNLREGKDFNKTCAQGCTSIDVNKASRLWDAFNSVGWFDEKWFQQHL